MSSILVEDVTVTITEVTVREIVRAIEKAKEEGASKTIVKSPWSKVKFLVAVENTPQSMESMGYQGEPVKEEMKGTPIPREDS